jgi:hypothetical protein
MLPARRPSKPRFTPKLHRLEWLSEQLCDWEVAYTASHLSENARINSTTGVVVRPVMSRRWLASAIWHPSF